MSKRRVGFVWGVAVLAIAGSASWAFGWIGSRPSHSPVAAFSPGNGRSSHVAVGTSDGSTRQLALESNEEAASAWASDIAPLPYVGLSWINAEPRLVPDTGSEGAAAQALAEPAEATEADFQSLTTTLLNCPSELPPQVDAGDPVVGAWVSPNRPNMAWSLFHLWSRTEGPMMQLVWHTFYPKIGGGATWLVSTPAKIQIGSDGTLRYSSTLRRPRFNVDGLGPEVGTVKMVFPERSATRAVLDWTWATDNKEDGTSLPQAVVGTQCAYVYGLDAPPSMSGPNPYAPPPTLAAPPETPASGEGTYEGIWIDPSVPGYQIEAHEVKSTRLEVCASGAPVIDCVPANAGFPVNPEDTAFRIGYTQFYALSIYSHDSDNSKRRPLWLYAQMGPYPERPSPNWINSQPSDYESTVVELSYLTANFLINQDCTGPNCITKVTLPKTSPLPNGHFFGRAFHNDKEGVIGLRAKLSGSTTNPSIDWPPLWPAYLPPGSNTAGCGYGADICRPVRMTEYLQTIKVDRTTCDLPTPASTCDVTLSWNAPLGAKIERLDQVSGDPKPHGDDGGIISTSPWGSFTDTLSDEEYVTYRLTIEGVKVTDVSVRAGFSTISASSPCLVTFNAETNLNECQISVTWNTPDVETDDPETDNRIIVQKYKSLDEGETWTYAGALAQRVARGTATDTIELGAWVYYDLRRSAALLSSTSLNPTIPVRATITPTPTVCPVSIPLNQTSCPVTVNWTASSAATIYRLKVGYPPSCSPSIPNCIPCSLSNPDCKQIGSGAGGPIVDNLPVGSNVYYIAKAGNALLAQSTVVATATSTITIDGDITTEGDVTSCTVTQNGQCSITVQWNSVAGAQVDRVDEIGGGRAPIPLSGNACGGACAVEWLSAGARVHYELMIGGVLHAVTSTVTAKTGNEGGDSSDGNEEDHGSPFAFAEPSLDTDSDQVGAIAGEFRVDESGGAVYRIPLAVPAGAGGLSPSLALVYNSGGGDSALGTGFVLEGASAITPCRRSVETGDGAALTPDPDQFCLDGQRLLLVAGTHRQVGAVYRTEIETFQRVKLTAIETPTIANHDATGFVFTVEGKDGSVRTYGGRAGTVSGVAELGTGSTSTSAVPEDVGLTAAPSVAGSRTTAQAWLQTRLNDVAGNAIAFQYSSASIMGERYLESVTYSGGSVAFEYVDSTRIDVAYSLLGPRRQSRLLGGIEIKAANGTTLRYYAPTYNSTSFDLSMPAWSRSRPVLISLQECSQKGGKCYPATTLTWSFASSQVNTLTGDLLSAKPGGYYKLGDFNGDKRTDLWWTSSPDGNDNALLHISAFVSEGASNTPTLREIYTSDHLFPDGYNNGGLWEVLDLNGDGRDDLLFAFANCGGAPCCPQEVRPCLTPPNRMSWIRRLSTGSGLGPEEVVFWVDLEANQLANWASRLATRQPSPNGTLRALGSSMLADVDGDGMADLVFRANDGAFWVALMKRTGDAGEPYEFVLRPTRFEDEDGAPIEEGNDACYIPPNLTREEENYTQATDFDGDGRADLRFLVNAQVYDGSHCVNSNHVDLQIFLAKDLFTKQGAFVFRAARPFGDMPMIYGDIDDDGDANPGPRVRTLDVNGDGLTDLVYQATVSSQWRYRLGGPYAALRDTRVVDNLSRDGTTADPKTLQLLDFDGDGKLDFWEDLYGNGTYAVRLWRGDNWSSTSIAGTEYSTPQLGWMHVIGDFDGDGSIDSLRANVSSRAWNLQRSKANHKSRAMVTKIVNGLGATTEIDYAPLTLPSVYRRDYNAPMTKSGRGSPVFDVATPNYVVRSVKSSAPTVSSGEAQSQVTYRYAGLKVQAGGRGSLGFRRVTSQDAQEAGNTEVSTYYTQRFPYIGLAEFSQTRNLLGLGALRDPCAQGPDAPGCMKYVPPCSEGLQATCDDDLRDIGNDARIIRESTDRWQWRMGAKVGALEGACITKLSGVSSEGFDSSPAGAGEGCTGIWAEPDELDRRALVSAGGPIFLARIQSLTSNYDLVGGAGVAALSSESTTFLLSDYDAYGNPKASKMTKSGGGASLETVSAFEYGNDEPTWRLGRLKTASVVTKRVTNEEGSFEISVNARRSSFTYDDGGKGKLISERVEGLNGTTVSAPVDTTVPAVATYYFYDTFGNRIRTFVCSTSISEDNCRRQAASGGGGYSFHPVSGNPAVAPDVMRHTRVEYDPTGRFVDASWERFSSGLGAAQAQEAASVVAARNAAGDPTRMTDVNGVQTEIRYGVMGRKRYAWTADGSSTRWDARYCAGAVAMPGAPTVACPAGMGLSFRTTTTKAGAPIGMTFHDRLGRPVVSLTEGFDVGSWIATIVQYDGHGNVKRKSDPFFARDAGANANSSVTSSIIWTETKYDALDRPIEIHYDGTGATTLIAYDGFRTVTTLPENRSGAVQTKTEIRNGLGEVVRAIDANGFEVVTRYDAAGNPVRISRGSQVTTMSYDSLGRKKSMQDPDAGSGSWVYQVNGAGEIVRQTSPKGTSTTNEYDGRGRVWRRTDYTSAGVKESESTWTYDLATKGKGALARESNGEVTRDFWYDDLGRTTQLETVIDGKRYAERWTFDPFGRPFQHLFKAPDVSGWTGERNVYGDGVGLLIPKPVTKGYLYQVRSAYPLSTGDFLVYRQIEAMTARGQVEREKGAAGSVYTQSREFDPGTGRLQRLLAQSTTMGALQDLRYSYDALGNVASRIDSTGTQVLGEEFHYDKLQRLTTSSVTAGGVTFYARSHSYSADGNLATKSDVGTYVYGTRPNGCASAASPGPHALSMVGSIGQCYDSNGNVVRQVETSNGREVRAITYNAADQAVDLVHNDNNTRVGFRYGPNRERVRRLDYDSALAPIASTVVHNVGGAEIRYRMTAGNVLGTLVDVRRYAGNILIVQDMRTGAYELKRQILLSDFQGGTNRVLSAKTLESVSGASTSFDAWGKRRNGETWSEPTPWNWGLEGLLQGSTTHGYTGHEMAESVGVIHMNGRLYDPHFARFLQADPFVQSPQDSQSWNRYTYAFNNPLAYTDPSGNISLGKAIFTAGAILITIYSGGTAAGLAAEGMTAQAVAVSVAGGFVAGAVQTGSLKGAAAGAVSAGVFFGIGSYFQNAGWAQAGEWENAFGSGLSYSGYAAKTLSHGIAGGVMAELQGGRFGHGFVSAGFSEALSPAVGNIRSVPVQAMAAAVIGGTASRLAGGKFANGAVTAAFGFAFNHCAHGGCFRSEGQSPSEFAAEVGEYYQTSSERQTGTPIEIPWGDFEEIADLDMSRARDGISSIMPWEFPSYVSGGDGDSSLAHAALLGAKFIFTGAPAEFSGIQNGSDVNYYHQGYLWSDFGMPRAAMVGAIAAWNVKDAVNTSHTVADFVRNRNLKQIGPASAWANWAYSRNK